MRKLTKNKEILIMTLSEKLIVLRKENGWSQEDFAEKLYVSRQAISRWENGTALPDTQNLLMISKLFNVSADYLLNDDFEEPTVTHTTDVEENKTEETKPEVQKKKHTSWITILAICLIVLLSAFAIITTMYSKIHQVHIHPALNLVKENEIASTCTTEGSYDEVIYCAECGEEILRNHITTGMPTHQFYNQTCIICGKDQREKD